MTIRKAVITAAGRSDRGLPLQTIVNRDGVEQRALGLLVNEAARAGAEEVAVVVSPGDEDAYRRAAGDSGVRLQFLVQHEPHGYGHAVLQARAFAGNDPVLHLVGDHLYRSVGDAGVARQVVEVAVAERCAVSAVQPTRETQLRLYGAIAARRVPKRNDLYEIQSVVEKPSPSEAELSLLVPGLRAGFYLCFFGIHVLTPQVFDLLAERAKPSEPLGLSPVLAELARRERYLALEVSGYRYNIGEKYGLLTAQLALALDGVDREFVLSQIVDLLAQRVAGGKS
jgi:UTP--glucose-1-phosphate uridylyltransferase